jgi:hypothetical protein
LAIDWTEVEAIGTCVGAAVTTAGVLAALWLPILDRRQQRRDREQTTRQRWASLGALLQQCVEELSKVQACLVRQPARSPGQSPPPNPEHPDLAGIVQLLRALSAVRIEELPWQLSRNLLTVRSELESAPTRVSEYLGQLAQGHAESDPLESQIAVAAAAIRAFDREAAAFSGLGYVS